jgi:hypothetical protein
MVASDGLDARLENWAIVQRMGRPGGSAIGSAEGRYRSEQNSESDIELMLIDERDAELVERAWLRLLPFDKDVLRMHYILRNDPRVICRKVRIPHRPANTFLMALAHAKSEIAKVLKSIDEARRNRTERHR